jgi:hypothetical protein
MCCDRKYSYSLRPKKHLHKMRSIWHITIIITQALFEKDSNIFSQFLYFKFIFPQSKIGAYQHVRSWKYWYHVSLISSLLLTFCFVNEFFCGTIDININVVHLLQLYSGLNNTISKDLINICRRIYVILHFEWPQKHNI